VGFHMELGQQTRARHSSLTISNPPGIGAVRRDLTRADGVGEKVTLSPEVVAVPSFGLLVGGTRMRRGSE
jgi:hypothetical protein